MAWIELQGLRRLGRGWVMGALALSMQGPVWAQAVPKPAERKPAAVRPTSKAASAPATAPAVEAKSGFSFQIAPAPGWVVPAEAASGAPAEAAPMHYRIIDEQVRVEGRSMAEYTRVVRVIGDASGLATAAQIELEFDPAYQTLTLHRLDVVRQGQHINKLDRKRIELLQREKQLEQRMYDGRVTASIVLDDMRVGDEIDLAYTVTGLNPVFAGKFVHMAWMRSQRGPVMRYQTRLLAPAERDIRILKGPSDATQTASVNGGWRETVFTRSSVPQMRAEPGAPASAFLPDQLQFSEFADWAEVAAWGDALFKLGAAEKAVLKADEIRAARPEKAAQVLEALRFVQEEVRYFGVEIGTSSHQPAAPDQVLAQRYGDCKDKVALLSALLRRLDVPVRPVLVSTRLRNDMDRLLPSPLAFDHVIARVDLDGKSLLLDPTRGLQTGTLAARAAVGMGQGLELAPAVSALSALAPAYETERMAVQDTIRVLRFSDDPVLESRIRYVGDLAEAMRDAVSRQGLVTLTDALNQQYVRAYPKLRRTAPPRVEPSTEGNDFTLVQQFEIGDFWRFPEQRLLTAEVVGWGPIEWLMPPKMEARQQPLAFPFPGIYRHQVRVEFAENVYQQPGSRRSEDGDRHFSVSVQAESGTNFLAYNAEVRILADQVQPADWAGFTAKLQQALPKLGSVVGVDAVTAAQRVTLGAEGKALEESLRRQRIKAVTLTQGQSHFKIKVLSAQLDSGRLPPKPRLQALVARGIANDHIGALDAARGDFEAALVLDPLSTEALNAAATNAQSRGAYEQAVDYATRSLAQQPREASVLQTRALAHYFAGRYAEARSDLDAALADRSALRRGYPLLWQALATRRAGQDLAPLLQKYPREQWSTEWPRPVLDAVFGTTTPDAALSEAKSSKTPLEFQTEALYYLGEKLAAEGNAAKAREQWGKAVDLGVTEFIEYHAARQRLAAPR